MGEALLVRKGGVEKVTIDGIKVTEDLNLITDHKDLSLSTLPYDFEEGDAVVLNDEIHILGTYNSYTTTQQRNHYKWNGEAWTEVSRLPYACARNSAIVLNGEIHILGGSDSSQYHYKWNGSEWTEVSTLPIKYTNRIALVLENEIYILNASQCFKWNGSAWAEASQLIYSTHEASAVTLNNEIHCLGGENNPTKHIIVNALIYRNA